MTEAQERFEAGQFAKMRVNRLIDESEIVLFQSRSERFFYLHRFRGLFAHRRREDAIPVSRRLGAEHGEVGVALQSVGRDSVARIDATADACRNRDAR